MSTLTIDPTKVSIPDFHKLMLGAIAPRPIAFVSTIDHSGKVNLSPFSFFNAFGSNPPTLIFSPARRSRDNTTKHTYENVLEVKEAVVNVVNYDIAEQMSLTSTEYEKGVNEFVKAGFTEVPSELIRPPRVKESPVAFECKVVDVIRTGNEGGAGNLIICKILLAHVNEQILDSDGLIDPYKIKLIGRMGGSWYTGAFGKALFRIQKPSKARGIGVDNIPEKIRLSHVLTGNDLGKLANVAQLPDGQSISEYKQKYLQHIYQQSKENENGTIAELHLLAKSYLEKGKIMEAWKVLLSNEH